MAEPAPRGARTAPATAEQSGRGDPAGASVLWRPGSPVIPAASGSVAAVWAVNLVLVGASKGSVRPGPVQWLRYSVGGRLPAELAPWVLKDATSRAWRWRLAARNLVYLIPLASVWLLLPGPLGLRLSLSLMAVVVGVFYSQAYGDESVELRVSKHGFEYGQARAIRREQEQAVNAASWEAYKAIYRS